MPCIVILESVQTVFSPLLVPNLYSDTLKPMNITELLENFCGVGNQGVISVFSNVISVNKKTVPEIF